MKARHLIFLLPFLLCVGAIPSNAQHNRTSFTPGELWLDSQGSHINAHGGGMLFHKGRYYWYGEHKGRDSNSALVGVTCYSSGDLYNWVNEGVALAVEEDPQSPIVKGCIIERPKVVYNQKTKKFVMYFHLELKGKGYAAANVGIAVGDNATGPFRFVRNGRVNAGIWPENMTDKQTGMTAMPDSMQWWTPEWGKAVRNGLFVHRDFRGGQMSRDMTLYVDDDGKAYHIYSSEENLTLHIAELTGDYMDYTGRYVRVEPGGHNEAPAIFKRNGRYYMITSGCTGWDPNAARLLTADSIWGPWKLHDNPCVGEGSELTFNSQSTFIFPVQGRKDAFIFMADRWRPKNPIDGRYVWLPVLFRNDMPVLKWTEEWDLGIFDRIMPDRRAPEKTDGWKLVWSDEFDKDGAPSEKWWGYEHGFVRNNELQWYQPENAVCRNGALVITGKTGKVENPGYSAGSKDWRKNRRYANYTSACVKTQGKKEFLYGRFEIRAKIPVEGGSWPAIWTLGNSMEWPSCGEIDIMEYYRINGVPHILANTAWGTDLPYIGEWNSSKIPFSRFLEKDRLWADKFHVWRMDWDEEAIRLYVDGELLNETLLDNTFNGTPGGHKNPFRQPHYILLNLAVGGNNGGKPDDRMFPLIYEIDYVRVYRKK